jgi:hypothetical protein
VGTTVIFLNGKPVCVTSQNARKSDTNYKFISVEHAKELREFSQSCINNGTPNVSVCDLDQDVGDVFLVSFTSQLLHDKVLYEGNLVDVDRVATSAIKRENYYTATSIAVIVDGQTKTVEIDEVAVPYDLDYKRMEAYKRYASGDGPLLSKSIADVPTAGYGNLSELGEWEFPLDIKPDFWINESVSVRDNILPLAIPEKGVSVVDDTQAVLSHIYGDKQVAQVSGDETADLESRLQSLSKSLESGGRIDEMEHPDAYATVLDAINFVRGLK